MSTNDLNMIQDAHRPADGSAMQYFRSREYTISRRHAYRRFFAMCVLVGLVCGALLMAGPVATDLRWNEEFASESAWHDAIVEFGIFGSIFGATMMAACCWLATRENMRLAFLAPILAIIALAMSRHLSFMAINGLQHNPFPLEFIGINLIFSSFVGIPVGLAMWFEMNRFRRKFPFVPADKQSGSTEKQHEQFKYSDQQPNDRSK